MERLISHGLNLDMMVGQGYDGAAVMSGHLKGVRTLISQQYTMAHFVHCAAHTLNLVLAHSSEVSMIRNCVGTVKNIITFLEIFLTERCAEENCRKKYAFAVCSSL
jgi:hypothetical protein